MKCSFNLTSEQSTKETICWFNSIGIDWITEECIHEQFIEIEFLDTPAILKVALHLESKIDICNISDKGVSFYLTNLMLGRNIKQRELHFESGSADGIIFVPMNNIESISTVGNIVLRKL
ncbi:hypothetical protein QUF74_19155 [Candidatus Halobeggiatoa sp. HSG11]|nr:hypothetical protein [Candidatus Halobeggiatoa sp. HSG11]